MEHHLYTVDWNIPPYADDYNSDAARTLDMNDYPHMKRLICREGSPSFVINPRPEVEVVFYIDPQREIYPYHRDVAHRAAPTNPKAISILSLAKKYKLVNCFRQ